MGSLPRRTLALHAPYHCIAMRTLLPSMRKDVSATKALMHDLLLDSN